MEGTHRPGQAGGAHRALKERRRVRRHGRTRAPGECGRGSVTLAGAGADAQHTVGARKYPGKQRGSSAA
ncbi:hypothetical protein GCM10007079_19380 [Nocardiopsis terrae]|nr:hypothetical protein GCM10007079_19380 [Nocardiopsis terrae]